MTLLKLEIKSLAKSLLIWSVVLILLYTLFLAFYPSMQNSAMKELANAKLKGMPPEILKILNLSKIPDFTNIIEYQVYVMQFFNLAIAVFASIIGTNALIKEETDGTIEYLYSQPITRIQIVIQKIIAVVLTFSVFIGVIFSYNVILLKILNVKNMNFTVVFEKLSSIYLGTYICGIVFIAIGFLISTIVKNSKLVSTFSIGIVFVSYILGIISIIVKDLEFLKYFSPLDIIKPTVMVSSDINYNSILGLVILSFVAYVASSFIYKRKNLNI